ncbi:dihydroorotate oxidase [Amylocystis lapponica]|nr:dihydroorotate oxidase [Amylocystis lapponica]
MRPAQCRLTTQPANARHPLIQVVFTTDRYTTLNSYGYSPHPLSTYLDWIATLLTSPAPKRKPIILSITASTPADLSTMLARIQALRTRLRTALPPTPGPTPGPDPAALLALEFNTSCPNIPGAPPLAPAPPLLAALAAAATADPSLALGLKLPPPPTPARPPRSSRSSTHTPRPPPPRAAPSPSSPARTRSARASSSRTRSRAQTRTRPRTPQRSGRRRAGPGFALPRAHGGLGGAQLHALALGTVLAYARACAAHPAPAVRAIRLVGVGGVTDRAARRGCARRARGVRAFALLGAP